MGEAAAAFSTHRPSLSQRGRGGEGSLRIFCGGSCLVVEGEEGGSEVGEGVVWEVSCVAVETEGVVAMETEGVETVVADEMEGGMVRTEAFTCPKLWPDIRLRTVPSDCVRDPIVAGGG